LESCRLRCFKERASTGGTIDRGWSDDGWIEAPIKNRVLSAGKMTVEKREGTYRMCLLGRLLMMRIRKGGRMQK